MGKISHSYWSQLRQVKRNWRNWLKKLSLLSQNDSPIRSLQRRKRESGVIVSFTTIPNRTKSVEYTLRSIIAGTCLPEGVYLYLSEKTFRAITAKESFLTRLVDNGFLHLKVVEDLRSHTKLVYALAEHPEKYIIVCDDDVMYPTYWLSGLLETHQKWSDPKVIVCHRAHEVSFDSDGTLKPYNVWPKEVKDVKWPTSLLLPTGTGGVLYPPKSMPALTGDSKLFLKVAPTADDIWFWFCAMSNGCRFSITEYPFDYKKFLVVPNSQSINLNAINVRQNANDTQINNCLEVFPNTPIFDKRVSK